MTQTADLVIKTGGFYDRKMHGIWIPAFAGMTEKCTESGFPLSRE